MAITKVGAMTDPPVAGDYTILQAKLDAYAKQVGNQGMILTQWTNTTTVPKIAMGSYITHGGTLFIVDTEDFAVTEPAGNGTYYLKVATSGATLAVSWVASLSGYTWNAIYNGLYHADESQILPYQLVKSGSTLTKRKITNLMQGSGFVTVDWTGAVQSVYFDQGVKTTDSPTFASVYTTGNVSVGGDFGVTGAISGASVDTGQGATEVHLMNQNLRTTDNVSFANLNPPVDNNDNVMPNIGIGGFTFGYVSEGNITLPPFGMLMVISLASNTLSPVNSGKKSGGAVLGFSNNTGNVFAWRIA